ncbi:MAG: hypothetical protein NZ455_16130 [Bacteroidia bacterium]|nr:hypothetical protein [Bacteroidia bacterium]MDW8348361.1 hypothetical protein [Bacteroidia bacterium]
MQLFYLFVILVLTCTAMGQHIIRKQAFSHCKKGWENCEKCQSVYEYKYALVLIGSSNSPEPSRPITKTNTKWVSYEVEKWFSSFEEAQEYSQKNNVPIEIADEDKYPVLQKLSHKLPPKWILQVNHAQNILLIYRPKVIYTYQENRINAQSIEEIVQKYGKKTYPHIEYTIKKPLTAAEREQINMKNEAISKQIQALPKKYNIEHLTPEYLHGEKENTFPNYPNATNAEKKRIQKYQKELKKLEDEYIPTPVYSTPDFDLWNESITGTNSALERVYPEEISEETLLVLKTIREFFTSNK